MEESLSIRTYLPQVSVFEFTEWQKVEESMVWSSSSIFGLFYYVRDYYSTYVYEHAALRGRINPSFVQTNQLFPMFNFSQ